MKDTTEILAKLRKLMQNPPRGSAEQLPPLSAYIIPSDDAHQSEYICKHDERRAYVSGFDGSAGTAVVTSDKALLWTDGRYYQQAGKQMDSNWTLMKDGLPTTPTIGAWLAKNLSKGSAVGVDPKLVSFRVWKPIQKDLAGNDCVLLPVQNNLIDIIWANEQPKQTSNKVITLDLKFCGSSIKEKWNELKKQMCEKKTEAIVVSALDEIAWFLNLRGSDIDYNPVFFAYLIVTLDNLNLFIDADKLPSKIGDHETINEVKIVTHAYNSVSDFLKNLANKSDEKIWIAPGSSYFLADLIPKQKRHQEITPIAIMKAIKNETEAQGFVNCHIRDGAALCKYFAWLEDMVRKGEPVNEISGASKLEEFRSKNDLFMGLSFPTISSSGPNGSVIHYHPAEETNRQIVKKEIYLCDSGAQYLDGTTDVTRTMHFGEPTEFEKETYTRVIKGQLSFGSIVFPNKVKGQVLDTLARKALWDVGLDYGHGTGHGVGHFLNVHEGPMGVGTRLMPDDPGLQENMFISNEPGYYKDGEFGIRIEDIVQIVKAKDAPYNFAGRGALTFKTVTMCPKQTKMIKKELLTDVELKLLNEYHELVLKTLSPIFEKDGDSFTLEWLKRNTQKL